MSNHVLYATSLPHVLVRVICWAAFLKTISMETGSFALIAINLQGLHLGYSCQLIIVILTDIDYLIYHSLPCCCFIPLWDQYIASNCVYHILWWRCTFVSTSYHHWGSTMGVFPWEGNHNWLDYLITKMFTLVQEQQLLVLSHGFIDLADCNEKLALAKNMMVIKNFICSALKCHFVLLLQMHSNPTSGLLHYANLKCTSINAVCFKSTI